MRIHFIIHEVFEGPGAFSDMDRDEWTCGQLFKSLRTRTTSS